MILNLTAVFVDYKASSMNIQPQFSGVYLKPTHDESLRPSCTGYQHFEHEGKSYYTTNEDTVTLHRAKQDSIPEEELIQLQSELAAKASQDTVPSLASIIASRITNSYIQSTPSNLRHLPQRTLARLLPPDSDRVEFSSPRRELSRRGIDENIINELEIGLNSQNKQG